MRVSNSRRRLRLRGPLLSSMVILAVGQNPLLASAHSYKVLYTFGFSGQELSQPEGGLLLD